MNLSLLNRAIAVIIILTNLYFIPLNYTIIRDAGGPMGHGFLILPILLLSNFLLISAFLTFKRKYKSSVFLLILNGLGLLWNLFFLWLFLTTPKM